MQKNALNILLADDDEDDRLFFRTHLKKSKYKPKYNLFMMECN